MPHPYRTIASITSSTLVACVAYCFGLAPLLEPPPKDRVAPDASVNSPKDDPYSEFAEFFEEGSWQLRDPFTLKTERGSVLFGDYRMGANGEIDVKPLSLVVRSGGTVEKPGRVFILDAPDGAVLRFENGLDLSKNSSGLGKLIEARLRGAVTIDSPATAPDADDALHIVTRGIQINQSSINTAQAVTMQFGPHSFLGQDLKLSFLNPEQKLKTSGAQTWAFSDLEITQVDLVQFFVAGDGIDLFGDTAKNKSASGHNSSRASVAAVKATEATPIEIRCHGRFKIDFLTMEGSFRDQVEVLRLPVRGQADSLRCDLLTLEFESGNNEGSGRSRFSSKFSPKRVKAIGRPVVLSSPSVDVEAKCEEMEYWIVSRKIALKDSKLVNLTRGTSQFKSPSIDYTLAKDPKRLGKLHARGRGELIAVDPHHPGRSIRAEWDQELKLEPEGALHRLEMRSGAGLFLAGDQHRFTAREMKLWLEESGGPPASVPAEARRPVSRTRRASWQEDELPPPKAGNAPQMMFDVRPKRMLAIGAVEADAPELKGHTQRMELVFNYPESEAGSWEAGADGQQPPPRNSPDRSRGEETRPEAKYDLVGDFIKVEIDSIGNDDPTIREVTVHKNLRFERFDLTDPSAPPLRVSGDQFRLTGGIAGDAEVVISGAPAEVSAENITITGPEIHLSQRGNRVYIEQPGDVIIRDLSGVLTGEGGGSQSPLAGQSVTPKLIEVSWKGGMDFDGKKVVFTGGVTTDLLLVDRDGIENEVEILSGSLSILLNRPVSFGAKANLPDPRYGDDLGLDRLEFAGGVDVTNDAFDSTNRRTAFDQLHSKNLSYDHVTGGFKADGPGYVSSVRRGMAAGSSAFAFPGGNSKTKPPVSPGRGDSKSGLTYLRVDFDGAITGNLLKRDLTFDRRVNAVYSPVSNWDSVIDPNQKGGLGEQGIALRSEEMSFFQVGETPDEANYEFEARGNVMIEGSKFTAYGSRSSYAPAKKLVMLEGNPRKDCEVHHIDEYGVVVGKQAAVRMTYRTDTQAVQLQDFGRGQINETPQMKLPQTGVSRPKSQGPTGLPTKPDFYRPGQR
jgi:hypothetical protein